MADARAGLNKFLKELALNTYNSQFGQSLSIDDFELTIVPTNDIKLFSYQLVYAHDENLRLRIYLRVEQQNKLNPFALSLDNDKVIKGALGDEIMVASGTIDRRMIEFLGYNLKVFIKENVISNGILTEDHDFILAEDGTFLTQEND